jgi:hypothetical protein
MAIARPANHELDHEFDGFDDQIKDGDLAAARADLRAAVVTERRFDRQLIALSFPPRTEPFVRLLYRVNQARAELTSTAAGVTSLRELAGTSGGWMPPTSRWKGRSWSSALSSACRRPIRADRPADRG